MLGYPIDARVQETLEERRNFLRRTKNPYKPTGGKNPSKEIQKNLVKTPYISMFSSPKLVSPTGKLDNETFPSKEDIILSNQEYNSTTDDGLTFTPINYGFNLYSDITEQNGKFKFRPDKNSDGSRRYQSQFKPQPGIISLTSEYQSTSNVYFVRNVSVTWRCHHIDDLERLSRRFLTLQRLVYVEWGWNYQGKERTSFINRDNLNNIKNPAKLRDQVLEQGKGNFDAVLGYISNFEWSSTGAGFECRTDIVSQGADILSQRISNNTIKRKKFKSTEAQKLTGKFELPYETNIYANSKNVTAQKIIKEKNLQAKLPKGHEGAEFTGKMTVTDKKDRERGKYKNLYTFEYEIPVELTKGKTFIQKSGDGGVDVQTQYGAQQIESLNYVLDNLDQTIKKRVFASEGGSDSPYDLSTYSLTKTIIKERFNVKEAELTEEWNKIKEQVQKEFDEDNWTNWPGGVKGDISFGGFRDEVTTETYRRWEEQKGITWKESSRRLDEQRKVAEANARNTNQTEYSTVGTDKDRNFVQRLVRTKEYTSGMNVLNPGTIKEDYYDEEGTLKSIYVPEEEQEKYKSTTWKVTPQETWVRWGWFEDNILSRFFGLVDAEGTSQLEFRSIRKSDKGGEEKQERITNHPNFLTEDINKFIFPGKFTMGSKDELNTRFQQTNEDYQKQGYEIEGMEKATAVKYIKRDKETDKIISRKFQINPENYSTYSSRISTTLSLEGLANLFQLNADDLTLEAYNEIKSENERFRFLSALEKTFSESEFTNSNGEKKSISFNDPDNRFRGILRNVYINLEHLKNSFKDVTTLGGALNLFLDSFNNQSTLFKIIPIVDEPNNPGRMVFTNINFLPDFKPETKEVYKFPIKVTDSYVKSTNLASDITAEGNKILLSQRYSEEQVNITDSKTGGNIGAQIDYDNTSLSESGDPEPTLLSGFAPYELVRLGKQKQNYGRKDGDWTKPLTFTDGENFGVISDETVSGKIAENVENRTTSDENTTETDIPFSIEFPGNYTEFGVLKRAQQEENADQVEQDSRFGNSSPYDELGLLFLVNTMSMDGVGGIFPGNIYTSNYLPDKFRLVDDSGDERCLFFIQNTSQTIDSSTWTTEISGRVLWNWKRTGGNILRKEAFEAFRDTAEVEVPSPDQITGDPELIYGAERERAKREGFLKDG